MNPELSAVEITPVEEHSSGEFPAGIEERFQVSYFHSGVMITYRLEKKASGLETPSWSPGRRKPDSVDIPSPGLFVGKMTF